MVPAARTRAAALRPMQQRSQPRYQYLLSLPPAYHEWPQQPWPLVLFLHGAGEGGSGELDRVKLHGVPRLVAAYSGDEGARVAGSRPEPVDPECASLVAEGALTVAPQLDYARHGYGWRVEGLMALLDELTGANRKQHPQPQQQRQRYEPWNVSSSSSSSSGGGGGSGTRGGSSGGGSSGSDVLEEPPVLLPLRVDTNRVYVTGVSMGGYGTWQLGAAHPERFAALAPVCGGADPRVVSIAALRDVPIWTFHGEQDEVIPVSASEEVMEVLQASGSAARFTRYPDLRHDCWTRAYNTPELWRWMLDQSRTHRDQQQRRQGGGGARGGGAGRGGGGLGAPTPR